MKIVYFRNCLPGVAAALLFASGAAARETQALEKLPAGATVVQLEAQPPEIALKHLFSYAQLLVTAKLSTGNRIDATRMVTFEKTSSAFNITPTGMIRPSSDGQARLRCT